MKKLRDILKEKDPEHTISQTKLAEASGWSLDMVKKLWAKSAMNSTTIERLCHSVHGMIKPADFFADFEA